jgi:hypothetical protein
MYWQILCIILRGLNRIYAENGAKFQRHRAPGTASRAGYGHYFKCEEGGKDVVCAETTGGSIIRVGADISARNDGSDVLQDHDHCIRRGTTTRGTRHLQANSGLRL